MESTLIFKLKMSPEQIEKFQAFFMEKSGLVFEGRRIQEMESAIAQRLITLGISSFDDYYRRLASAPAASEELNHLALTLTVGETHFFRTPDQFAALRKYVLPELIERARPNGQELRLLSAGCATGEEAYTLCMILHELLPDFNAWKITIRACDINREFLAGARDGTYGERRVRLMDPVTRDRFLERRGKNQWAVKDFLARPIEWSHFNLNAEDYSPLSQGELFHLVLCRNVLIYFNLKNLSRVIERLHAIIHPGGYLMLGYSETLFKISEAFQSVHTPEAFFYQKTEKPLPPLPALPL